MRTDALAQLCRDNGAAWCSDPQSWHAMVATSHDLCEALMPALAEALNEIHGRNMSVRFWQIVIGPWLGQFVGVICDRVTLLESAPDQGWDDTCAQTARIIPRTVYESIKLIETSEFGDQLLLDVDQVMRGHSVALAGEKFTHSRDHLTFGSKVDFVGPNPLLRNIFNIYKRVLTPRGAVVVSNASIPYRLHHALRKRAKRVRSVVPVQDPAHHYDAPPNVEARAKLAGHLSEDGHGLAQIITQLIPSYLPLCFLETFSKMIGLSRKYPTAPSAILMGTEIYGRYESFCYWAASNVESGTFLATMQHGGTYGNENASEFVFPEITPVDRFYSWGWKWAKYGLDVSKITPMPAMFLVGAEPTSMKAASDTSKDILFVSTALHPNVRRLCGSEGRPYYNDDYVKQQGTFYHSLAPVVRDQLVVRLYPGGFGDRYRDTWVARSPDVRIDDASRSFDHALDQCHIFVTDHLSTTWLQALSLNKPSVLFIDFDQYDFTREALGWMRQLQDAKILHDSPPSAADHIAAIAGDVDAWWAAGTTQTVLAAFLEVFAFKPENAMQLWAEELNGLSRVADMPKQRQS